MRLIYASVLLLVSLSLTACKSVPVPADPCAWAVPITFAPDTKEWLAARDWSPTVTEDFAKIVAHNEKVKMFCGNRLPAPTTPQ